MTKEQLLRIENKVDNLSNQVSGLYAQINHHKDDLSNQIIEKIKKWLESNMKHREPSLAVESKLLLKYIERLENEK